MRDNVQASIDALAKGDSSTEPDGGAYYFDVPFEATGIITGTIRTLAGTYAEAVRIRRAQRDSRRLKLCDVQIDRDNVEQGIDEETIEIAEG